MTRSREIDEDAHLNDPNLDKIRKELAALVQKSDEQIEDHNAHTEDAEEAFTAQSHRLTRKRGGPISNQDQNERVRRVEEQLAKKEREGTFPVRQSFNPDKEPEKEEGEEEREVITNGTRPRRVAGNNPNSPIDPPDITAIQRLEKRLADQEAEIKNLKLNQGVPIIEEVPKQRSRLASRQKVYDSKFVKLSPPSNCIFYDFSPDDLLIKKIDIVTQTAITNARRVGDMSAYIDALATTLTPGIDLRDFTNDDWFYFLYWHKFNSYNKTPLIMTWTSKYGNRNTYSIQESDLKYINPIITKDEYFTEYRDKGFRVPTLRDWEILNVESDLTPEDLDIYSKAQYFHGDTIEDKVDNYYAAGETVEALETIAELRARIHHGVVDTVDVVDAKFDPEEYIKTRKENIESLRTEAERYRDNSPLYFSYMQEVDELLEEVNIKETTLKNGGEVRAEVETHPVRFNALDIFPVL